MMSESSRWSIRWTRGIVLLLLGGAWSACSSPAPSTSSSSHWISCKSLADCSAAPNATDCVDGYCVDSASQRVSSIGASDCGHSKSLADAGPGVTPCSVGRAFVECTDSGGAGCLCVSDDPTSCSLCNLSGATCVNRCAEHEYALSCGGPPQALPDGGFGKGYQDAPAGCVSKGATPGGNQFWCCPCE